MHRILLFLVGLALANPAFAQQAFIDPQNGAVPQGAGHPRAFPSAVGFGSKAAVRAADRVVYRVNDLGDAADPNDGKITLRECVMALAVNTPYTIPAGKPRVCVFDVGGQIVLNTSLRIAVPKLYIAGQTAPFPGIEVKMGPTMSPVDAGIHFYRGGDDMIVRHVRFRTGAHSGGDGTSYVDAAGNPVSDTRALSQNGDPFRVSFSKRIIFDHVTSQYGTDESFDVGSAEDVTVQWSVMGPNICRRAGHGSPGGQMTDTHCKTAFFKPVKNLSVYANFSGPGVHRGMNLANGVSDKVNGLPVFGTHSQIDVINNIIYHYSKEFGLISNQFGHVWLNYHNNVVFRGPRFTATGNYPVGLYAINDTYPHGFRVYVNGNTTFRTRVGSRFYPGNTVQDSNLLNVGLIPGVVAANICGIDASGNKDCSVTGTAVASDSVEAIAPGQTSKSITASSGQITNSEQAARAILAYSGADLCRGEPCRDAPTEYYLEDFRTCDADPRAMVTLPGGEYAVNADGTRGAHLYAGYMTGGPTSVPVVDTDHDGMPDAWESAHGLNPSVANGNADADGDGYTNLEEYLAEMALDNVRGDGFISTATGAVPFYNCGYARTP